MRGHLVGAMLILFTALVSTATASPIRFFPADAETGAAVGTQSAPAIAAGAGGYLAVWQDLRTSPVVGPPFSTEGRGFDIYARRLAGDGSPAGDPQLIAQRFGDQTQPQVAWNGENWLVIWGGPNSTAFNHRIQGVRLSPSGVVLDATPIAIHNTAYPAKFRLTTHSSVPAQAAEEWLVALQSSGAGEADIRAVRITASGQVINPGGTQLLPTSTSLYNIDIASAQGELLLVWGNSAASPQGQRFDANLNAIGTPFPVSSLRVVSNGSGYFQVWSINDTYFDDFVYGRRLEVDGTEGPRVTVAGGGALPLWSPSEIDATWDGTHWWVSWAQITGSVAVARVTPDDQVLDFGGLVVNPTAVDRAALQHRVSGAPGGGLGVIWSDQTLAGASQRDIRSAHVDSGGFASAPQELATAARAQFRVDFANAGNQALAVYLSEQSGVRQLLGLRLDTNGDPLDPTPFEIAGGTGISAPHVGFDGTRYLVVWADAGQTYGRRVSTAGTLIDPSPLFIMDSSSPDVAGLDGRFLVVGTRPTISIHFYHPFSMRVDGATGSTLDAAPVLLGQYFARNPRVIAFGNRWLATWQRNISHDDINSSAYAAFVATDGTPTPEFGYAPGGATPDLASAGDRALLVWRLFSPGNVHNDIQGRLLHGDETLGAIFDISATDAREFDPAVTWNGTEFVVAWTDKRSSVIYFDNRSEVFAARVSPEGVLIDPAASAFGDRALPEALAALVSLGGNTLIAASSFRDEPALQTYRLAYQVLGNSPAGNRWPVATATSDPTAGEVPLTVNFDAAGTADPDGAVADIAWDFGDGGQAGGTLASHTYNIPGEYLAEVTVTDNQGATTRNTRRVLAEAVNQPPVAVASATPTSGRAPLSVIYQAAGSYDRDDGIARLFWQFGDGGTYYGGTAYHTYSVPGSWITTLTVTDQHGASSNTTLTIEVGEPNQPPTAVASADPTSGISPLTVQFSAAGSSDPDGTLAGYLWQFGDGTTSTEPNPSHIYESGGLFEATLVVSDNEGGSGQVSIAIDVTQGDISNLASADYATEAGLVASGSYLNTDVSDGLYEVLQEEVSNGNPSKRRSQLSHTWAFNVTAGTSYRFYVTAHHSSNGENDHFGFDYSRDGVNFTPMLVVENTTPAPAQAFEFTEDVGGTLYVRVRDTNRTPGNSQADNLFVDEMRVVTSWNTPAPPPPPPNGTATSLHIADILLVTVNAGKGAKRGQAQVQVLDDLGQPVAGANVTGSFSGALSGTPTATSDGAGIATLLSDDSAKGGISFGFCVDNIASTDLPYTPGDNAATCANY